ncbi:MAG TPA: DUF1648 domain-containing protein [Kofleriaceae bacterium]|nr:DUF1648 domain-containing protein [Kofleriaceae bacterium]
MSVRIVRDSLGVIVPLVWSSVAIGSMRWAWDRLPEPMAAHWGISGAPNAALPRAVVVVFLAVMAGMSALGAFAVTRQRGARPREIAAPLAMASFLGVLAAILAVMVVALNLDAPSWSAARRLTIEWLAALIATPVLAAAVTGRLAALLEADAAPVDLAGRASIGLGATERAIWTGSAANPWCAAWSIAITCAGVAALLFASVEVAAALVLGGLVLACFAVVRVRVDGSCVTISFGPLSFPRQRMPLSHILAARVVDVWPLGRGGWGYRGSLLFSRRASIVVRRGEGIELDCGARGTLVITVDNPGSAAGLINDLVSRARRGAGE